MVCDVYENVCALVCVFARVCVCVCVCATCRGLLVSETGAFGMKMAIANSASIISLRFSLSLSLSRPHFVFLYSLQHRRTPSLPAN